MFRSRIRVSAIGLVFALGAVSSSAARADTGSISGALTDAAGRPLAGAVVTARRAEETSPELPAPEPPGVTVASAVSDADGRYRIDGLRPGRYALQLDYGDASETRADIQVVAGRDTPVDWRVDAAAYRVDGVQTAALSGGLSGSVRSQVSSWMITPAGSYEIGGELRLLTSEPSLGAAEIDLTDVVLLRLLGRYSIRGRAEIYGGVDTLPKQPTFTDEPLIQGGFAGVRVGVKRSLALWAQADVAQLVEGDGLMLGGSAGVQGRHTIHETVTFQGALGGAYTSADLDEDADGTFDFIELITHAETLIHAPNRVFGMWLGAEFRFPIAANTGPDMRDPTTGRFLDPQTRVNLHVGMVYALIDNWDLYADLAILDRGELEDPPTTLPVLDGGFDQRQIVFGVIRRFQNTRTMMRAWSL